MKEITRINHVDLGVRDLNIARAFYEKLGFEFSEGLIGPEPVAVVSRRSTSMPELLADGSVCYCADVNLQGCP